MIKRFPHIATLVINSETDNNDGFPTVAKIEIPIKGRFEPSSQSKTLNYSAKWYCEIQNLQPFENDGKQLVFNGKTFKITQLFNYQSHCEIWLE